MGPAVMSWGKLHIDTLPIDAVAIFLLLGLRLDSGLLPPLWCAPTPSPWAPAWASALSAHPSWPLLPHQAQAWVWAF